MAMDEVVRQTSLNAQEVLGLLDAAQDR